jgi:membrane protease YdiL (CAAX protease family)
VPLFLAGGQHWSDLLLIVAAAVVFTWVFQNARQSVLVVMVLHAMNNAVAGNYLSEMFAGGDSVRQSWLLVLVWGTAAALIVLFTHGFRESHVVSGSTR